MGFNKKVYKKQNSFIEISHRDELQDVLPRIEKLDRRLEALNQTNYQKDILKAAISDIFGRVKFLENASPFALHSFNIAEIKKLSDEELPRFLFYRYRYEMFPQRLQIDEFPPCLQIEPASICNYRCLFCYQIDEEFTKKSNGMMGVMTIELFEKIIDQAEGRCEAVTLASRGEPLICPDIEAMLRYAGGKFIAFKLNTNAWFLDEKLCHAILESGVNTVVYSAEAASEPSYSKFRVNGNLDRVYRNIKRFHNIREKHYSNSRVITRVSGVKVPHTEKLEDMEKFWGDYVDQVAFVKYNPWENTYEQPINGIETPCSDLWRRMFIWWDGSVNPCDSDYKSTLNIGNGFSEKLSDLWCSQKYKELRSAHLAKQRNRYSPCNRCVVV